MKKNSNTTSKGLIFNNYDILFQKVIERHLTIFTDTSLKDYSRIIVKHWDGSTFNIHGARYEYAILRLTDEGHKIMLQQRMLIIYPEHHLVLLFFNGDLQFTDVYEGIKKKRVYDALSNFDVDDDNQYYYMDSFGEKSTGIKNVWVWVGPNLKGLRVIVSKPKNLFSGFAITIPDFQIIGTMDKAFMTKQVLQKIKKWIQLNQKLIIDYSNLKISLEDFLYQVKKV